MTSYDTPSFAFLPAGDEDVASSRIRVFTLARVLERRGIPASIGAVECADVVVVQKRVTREILDAAHAVADRGGSVVFDVDDLGWALWWWTPRDLFRQMVDLADLVTTASDAQRPELLQLGARSVAVIPCAADYEPAAPSRPALRAGTPLRVLWFGNNSNYDLLARYLDVLRGIPDVELVVMIDDEAARELSPRYPEISVVPWSRRGFVQTLQSCDLTVLMHDGNDSDRAKSNTRMVTSVVWGVPAAVSATPEYLRTAVEARVEDAVFEGPSDVGTVVERFRSAASRARYLDTAQPRLWDRYSPDSVADRFLAAVAERRPARAVG